MSIYVAVILCLGIWNSKKVPGCLLGSLGVPDCSFISMGDQIANVDKFSLSKKSINCRTSPPLADKLEDRNKSTPFPTSNQHYPRHILEKVVP